MAKISLKQRGFSIIELLLIIIIIGVIGFVGWFVYNSKKTTDSSYNNAANTQVAKPVESKSKATTQSAGYLDIKEMGVRIKLTPSIKDAYYAYKDGFASISLHSLTSLDSSCSPTGSSQADIGTFTDPNGTDFGYGGTNIQAYPNAKKIGGKYFYLRSANGPCSNDQRVVDYQTNNHTKEAFIEAGKSIEAL